MIKVGIIRNYAAYTSFSRIFEYDINDISQHTRMSLVIPCGYALVFPSLSVPRTVDIECKTCTFLVQHQSHPHLHSNYIIRHLGLLRTDFYLSAKANDAIEATEHFQV